MSIADKTKLLTSPGVITQEKVVKTLGIKPGSAANLLTKWNNEGVLQRAAPGCYISSFAKDVRDKALIESLQSRLGEQMIFVGASSWKSVGWCDSETLYVAVPIRPSRQIPRVKGAVIYPVGAKQFQLLLKNSTPGKNSEPPSLHPIVQMLWWMDKDCQITMPAPATVNWDKVDDEPRLKDAIKTEWPELQSKSFTVESVYELIHMDRLTGTIQGSAEDSSEEEGEHDSQSES